MLMPASRLHSAYRMPSSGPIGPATTRLYGETIRLPPQQSGLRRNFSPSGPTSSLRMVSSSTVPQAEITHALLIWANACESIATRLRSGSPLVGKWFGQLITWMRVCSAVSAKMARGFEFSPQISPLTGPNCVCTAPKVSPKPPVCTSRSPTVGMIFWCLPSSVPSGPNHTWVLNRVPSVFGIFSHTPITT